jgi:gamma-glutamylputrescine oxidase
MPGTADVLIIGGGILGVCCAYWLAKLGHHPVLLERKVVAAGATGRNGGMVIPATAEPYPGAIRRLGAAVARSVRARATEGLGLLRETVDAEEIDCDLRAAGHLQLALGIGQLRQLADEAACLAGDGFAAHILDRQALLGELGVRLSDEVTGAVYLPGMLLNPVALVRGIAAAAIRHGARVHCGVDVRALETHSGEARARTNYGAIAAASAIVATNAWLGQLVPALSALITPVQGQVLATGPVAPMLRTGMSALLTDTGEYWQQTTAGEIVIGGCRAASSGQDLDPLAEQAEPAVHGALMAVLSRVFPDLGPVRAAHGWAGAMAFTPDLIPVAAPVTDRVWAVGGFSGHGMPYAASISRLLVGQVTASHGSGPVPDLEPFGLSRTSLQPSRPPARLRIH